MNYLSLCTKEEKTLAKKLSSYMQINVENFCDGWEVNSTLLAEDAAAQFDPSNTWLDDETHVIWDVALEVAEEYENHIQDVMPDYI